MVMYEFRCPRCRKDYTVPLDPSSDDLSHQKCPKGHEMHRVYSVQIGHIDWVNGGFHGDEKNLGLGRHFKSAKERDYWAAKNGFVKQDKYGGDVMGDEQYKKRKAAKERAEKRAKARA